jgi:hypothetical protein
MTYYLRFPDEATFRSAAFIAGFCDGPERPRNVEDIFAVNGPVNPGNEASSYNLIAYTHDHAIDVIGTIYNDDAVIDGETGEITSPATPMDGWHVNYIGELPTGWGEFLVSPAAPYRVFA